MAFLHVGDIVLVEHIQAGLCFVLIQEEYSVRDASNDDRKGVWYSGTLIEGGHPAKQYMDIHFREEDVRKHFKKVYDQETNIEEAPF